MTAFVAVAALMTVAAILVVAIPLCGRRDGRAPLAALVAAVIMPLAVVLLYMQASNFPWRGGPPAAVAMAGPQPDSADIQELKQRTVEQPGDVGAWAGLGEAYMSAERYAEARQAFQQAIVASNGGDDALRLSLVEASILEDRNALQGQAAAVLDDVLQRDPFNPKALWYAGMAALARGDAATARQRWGKLLELSPPPRVREILEQQLANLGASPGEGATAAAAAGARIPVRITMAPGMAARVKPGAVLFLIAREPGAAAGPPLAVVRREAPQLPLDLEISDADSMMPGRSLASHAAIHLTARLAGQGDARATPGDLFGEATWHSSAKPGAPVQITVDQVVP